ncbi:MAG: hypothetical protein UT39_C0007G0033 [Candidatus Woesebacteria bacterium GW2011_GWA1_39_21]|uniref:Bacterial membrane protein YfhO n=1 Tax=Candidatus Woesebacteria bacterium GW2011_GWA1_39_21 TaxID=1618550 RepID=A0A0G0N7N0_9BACT|nr:MAG: hypothetical protein UT39_C0007G0033 [Candidatus Woesebacteria bacterium GW2011_GWA1_39_21]
MLLKKFMAVMATCILRSLPISLRQNLMLSKIWRDLIKKLSTENVLLLLLPFLLTVFVFRKYIFEGLLPIPADITPGLYFPWFDYKWGYATPVPVQNPAITDVISILYPWRVMAFRYLNQGILPFWDPTILLGTPLLANFQTAFFNPVNILFLFVKEFHAWSLGIIIQPLLLTFTSYLFLRNLNLMKMPSLFGAILFAYSSYAIVWMEYNSIDYTLVYFPLILLCVSKLAEESGRKWFFVLSGALALQIISGYPQNVIYTILISVFYFVVNLKGKRNKFQKILFVLGSLLMGLLLSGVQLFPSLELYSLSLRNLDKVALAGNVKYLPLKHLMTFPYPDYFGNPGRWNYFGVGSYDNFAFTISSVGIFFAILSFFVKNKVLKNKSFFIFLILGALIFSTKNPISQMISNTSFLGIVSGSNARVLFVVSFVLSLFAASGLQVVLKWKPKVTTLLIPALLSSTIFLLHLIYLNYNLDGGVDQLFNLIANRMTAQEQNIANLVVSIRNMILPTLVVFVLTLFVLIDRSKKKLLTIVCVIACLFVTVISASDKYLPFVKKELLYPQTEVTDFLLKNLGDSRFEKENNNLIFPSNSWSLYGLSASTGQNASTLLSISRYFSLINYGQVNDAIATRYNSIINFKSPLVNTLNISYYTGLNWLNDSPDANGTTKTLYLPVSFSEMSNIGTVRIFKNAGNIGPAWFPEIIKCEKNEEIVFREIASEFYNPKEIVYVDCSEDVYQNEGGSVNRVPSQSNKLVFNTESESDGYLVVSAAFYPGWTSYVDGQKIQNVNKANTALIALPVAKGSHLVELKYEPFSFKFGVYVSLTTLIIWVGILLKQTKPGPTRSTRL